MKKTLVKMCAIASMASVFTGCMSTSSNDGANQIGMEKLQMPSYAPVIEHKATKVSGSAEMNVWVGLFAKGDTDYAENTTFNSLGFFSTPTDKVKNAAVYNACKKHNADMLLGTKYSVTEKDYVLFKTLKCTVTGFPAVVKDVKEVK